MTICVYGTAEDGSSIAGGIASLADYAFRKVILAHFDRYDDFIGALRERRFDAVFVTADNAEGMEGVIAAKSVCSDTPVVWLSNDSGFGAQSYRLGCAYFAEKSFTGEKLAAALSHCDPAALS